MIDPAGNGPVPSGEYSGRRDDEALEELQSEIDHNRYLLREMDRTVHFLALRASIQLCAFVMFGVAIVLGAIWLFSLGFKLAGAEYTAVAGAAFIFALFFFYEMGAFALMAYSRLQRGKQVRRAQIEALAEARLVYRGDPVHGR